MSATLAAYRRVFLGLRTRKWHYPSQHICNAWLKCYVSTLLSLQGVIIIDSVGSILSMMNWNIIVDFELSALIECFPELYDSSLSSAELQTLSITSHLHLQHVSGAATLHS